MGIDNSEVLAEVTLQGARNGNTLSELPVPPRFVYVAAGMPQVSPYNVGQLYSEFAHAIRTGQSRHPAFDTAVDLHHFIDAMRQSSDSGREVILG